MEMLINVVVCVLCVVCLKIAYNAFAIKPYTRAYAFKNGINASKMYNDVASKASKQDIETYEVLSK